MSAQIDVKMLKPSATNGHDLITFAGVAAWGNDYIDQNKFTTGSFYSGTNTTASESAGSHIAVSTVSTALRGIISSQYSTDTNSARFVGTKARGTRGAPTIVVSGDTISRYVSAGYDGTSYIHSALISFEADAVVSAGVVPQAIIFYTGSSAAPSEKFRLASSGTYVAQVSGNLSATGSFAAGTNPATSGALRLASTAAITARNAANNNNFVLIQSDASNNIDIGQSTIVPTVQINSTTNFNVAINGNQQIQVTTTRLELTRPTELSWARTVVSPTFIQQIATSGTAQPLWIHAQGVNLAGATGDGGRLVLSGGKPDGSGLRGSIGLALNPDDVFANRSTMLEACEVVQGNRVIALVRTGILTSTEMPANTGDGVIYVSNRQTAPSANPVSGFIMYGNSGAGVGRGTGGTVTTFIPA